jgi:CubicO group peptidase (beta-lactamase class C family)
LSNKKKSNKTFQKTIELLKEEIPKKISEENILGLSIVLLTNNKVIWSQGYGYTDHLKTQEVNQETLLGLQSTSKTFTAIGFLKAVENKLVDLDDPLIHYYPEFQVKTRYEDEDFQKITFRHLLSHNSGLATETILGGCFNNSDITFNEHIESIKDTWQEYRVGTRKRYSNIGIDLVAYALQKITGKTYPEYMREGILKDLGLTSVKFESKEALQENNVLKGYLGKNEAVFTNIGDYGCGSIFISSKDLIKFVQFLLNEGKNDKGEQLISKSLIQEMLKGEDGDYGFGVFTEYIDGHFAPNHPGGGFGYISHMTWVPDHNIGVIIQLNQEYQGYSWELNKRVIQLMLKDLKVEKKKQDEPEEVKDFIKVEKHLLEMLEGTYAGLKGSISIIFNNDKLYFKLSGKEYELSCVKRESNHIFRFVYDKSKFIDFTINKTNSIPQISFNLRSSGRVIMYKIIPEDSSEITLDQNKWKEYLGLYRMFFYGIEATYLAIYEKDGNLTINGQKLNKFRDGVYSNVMGEVVEFEKDYLHIASKKAIKLDDPVKDFYDLYDENPNHRYLSIYSLGEVEKYLKNMNRNEEAEKIVELKEKMNINKKK